MKRWIKLILGTLIFVILLLFILGYLEDRSYRTQGKELIVKIEEFLKKEGRLPDSIDEIETNLEMGEGPYYNKKTDSTYVIYFNIGMDNSYVYSSLTEKWSKEP